MRSSTWVSDWYFYCRQFSRMNVCCTMLLITARKRSLRQGNIFRSVCQEFCSWGVGGLPVQVSPRTRYTPGPGTPPRTRYTPRTRYIPQAGIPPRPGTPPRQVHPAGPGTPPGTRYTPGQVHGLAHNVSFTG